MTHNKPDHKHGHAHDHKPHHGPFWTRAHRDWRTWVIVALMLVAMAVYVLSLDESLVPGGGEQPAVPAAP